MSGVRLHLWLRAITQLLVRLFAANVLKITQKAQCLLHWKRSARE
jgi:hypothetical protein